MKSHSLTVGPALWPVSLLGLLCWGIELVVTWWLLGSVLSCGMVLDSSLIWWDVTHTFGSLPKPKGRLGDEVELFHAFTFPHLHLHFYIVLCKPALLSDCVTQPSLRIEKHNITVLSANPPNRQSLESCDQSIQSFFTPKEKEPQTFHFLCTDVEGALSLSLKRKTFLLLAFSSNG